MLVVLENLCLDPCGLLESLGSEAVDDLGSDEIELVPVHVQQILINNNSFSHNIIDLLNHHAML